MAPTIEARSLAALASTAANPPSRPQDHTKLAKQPLVLYIARVPGSRDIFLTTLKPTQRVVTAQDIQSSLYYLHANSPDENSLEKVLWHGDRTSFKETVKGNGEDGIGASSSQKPLMSSPYDGSEMALEEGDLRDPFFQDLTNDIREHVQLNRKPVDIGLSTATTSGKAVRSTFLPGQLLGPRPMRQRLRSMDSASLRSHTGPEQANHRRWSVQPPALSQPSKDVVEHQKSSPVMNITNPTNVLNSSYEQNTRRTEFQNAEPASLISSYDYSLDFQSRSKIDGFSTTLIRRDPSSGAQWNVATISGPFSDLGVSNVIGSTNSRVSSKQSKLIIIKITTEGYSKFPGPDGEAQKPFFQRQLEIDRGFTFISPWNGLCSFSTGVGGRTLKCKHTFLQASNGHADGNEKGNVAITLSELRLNLPSSNIFRPVSPTKQNPSHQAKEARDFIKHLNPPDPRLDLSLGQERAGGGFGGRAAKLGKLIVEPRGIEMLDLIVAANMAVWCRVWEKHCHS